MIYSHEYLWWGGEVTSKRLKSNKILGMFDFLLFWERICKNARRNTLRSAKDVCVCTCMCLHVLLCACVWRPEVIPGVFLCFHPSLFAEIGSFTDLRSDLLASALKVFSHLCLPSTRNTYICHQRQLFVYVQGIQTQLPKLQQQATYP